MAEIFLIRHGQSANNASDESLRVSDPGLTRKGQEQAEATAQWMRTQQLDYLYCSPFLRSLETTRPIADSLRVQPFVWSELCEQGGCYEGHEIGKKRGVAGMSRRELEARYPGWQLHETTGKDGWWDRPYETIEEARQRAKRVVAWMETSFESGWHTLVIHADFKRRLLEALLPQPELAGDVLGPLRNAGVTHLTWSGVWKVQTLNATNHLTPNLITI